MSIYIGLLLLVLCSAVLKISILHKYLGTFIDLYCRPDTRTVKTPSSPSYSTDSLKLGRLVRAVPYVLNWLCFAKTPVSTEPFSAPSHTTSVASMDGIWNPLQGDSSENSGRTESMAESLAFPPLLDRAFAGAEAFSRNPSALSECERLLFQAAQGRLKPDL